MESNSEIIQFADNLYKQQNYQEALTRYLSISEQIQDNDISCKITRCYIKTQNYEKALEIINNILQKDHTFVKAYVIKSGIYYYKQQFKEMVECCQQGLQYDPENKDLKYNLELGKNSSQDNADKANEMYNTLKSHPEIKEYFKDGDFVQKLSLALRDENYLQTCKDERIGKAVKVLYEKTIEYKQENEQLVKQAEEFKNQGNQFYSQNQLKEAIECYNQAFELNNQEATYLSNKCLCLIKLNQLKEAEEAIDQAISLFEQQDNSDLSTQEKIKYSKIYLRKAAILEQKNQSSESTKFYQKVLNLDPTDKEAIKKLDRLAIGVAMTYFQTAEQYLKESKYSPALNQINLACKIDEKNTKFLVLQAECLFKLLEQDEALQILEKALKIDADCKEVYPLKGQILQKQCKYKEAHEAYDKGLKLNPGNQQCVRGIMETSFDEAQTPLIKDKKILEIAKLVGPNQEETLKLLQKINDNPNSPESQALLKDPKIQLMIQKLNELNMVK